MTTSLARTPAYGRKAGTTMTDRPEWMDVEATHITKRMGPVGPKLACELYPGYFIVDGGGVHYAHTAGRHLEKLPSKSGRTFPIPVRRAEEAAEWYDTERELEDAYAQTAHLRHN